MFFILASWRGLFMLCLQMGPARVGSVLPLKMGESNEVQHLFMLACALQYTWKGYLQGYHTVPSLDPPLVVDGLPTCP